MKLENIWYKHHVLSYLLFPCSAIFNGIVRLRRWIYQAGLLKTVNFQVPIIVVGNITVGGTGKTPLTIYIANALKLQGYKPGIVSRGYPTNPSQPQRVTRDSTVQTVGDEAIVIQQRTQCSMAVAVDRVKAVEFLLQQNNCDVIICDDGLQHYALGRDIEIAVIDGQRIFGNGLLLPAGPLREPIGRLKTVDFIVSTEKNFQDTFRMDLQTEPLRSLIDNQLTQDFATFVGREVHAVAGIGNPDRFFQKLRDLGLSIIEHVFPDHHIFRAEDINFDSETVVIMTEKDAVKCKKFADYRHWYLPVTAELDETFMTKLLQKLRQLRKK